MSTAYQRVADSLRHLINSGEFRTHEKLPGEMELARTYGVSRNTVRQALSQLEASNLIRRQQGKGTFLTEHGVSHVLGNLMSFTATLRELGKVPGISDISITVDPNPPDAAAQFLPGSHLWNIARVRTADGRPFCRMQSWVPDAIADGVGVSDLEEKQSLYEVLGNNLAIFPATATEIIRSEPASPEDAEKLNISVGTALLTTYRWTSDQRGQPIEYVRNASPGDRYEYVIKLVE